MDTLTVLPPFAAPARAPCTSSSFLLPRSAFLNRKRRFDELEIVLIEIQQNEIDFDLLCDIEAFLEELMTQDPEPDEAFDFDFDSDDDDELPLDMLL